MQIEQELERIAQQFIAEVQQAMESLNINASGESSRSLRYEITSTDAAVKMVVYGNPGIFFTDKGRGPTRGTGNGSFTREDAKKWARDKGVGTWYKESKKGRKAMNADEQAYLIWRKVHQKGFYGNNSEGKEYLEAIRERTTNEIRQNINQSVFEVVKQRLNLNGNRTSTAA
jgi:hypothetical protein